MKTPKSRDAQALALSNSCHFKSTENSYALPSGCERKTRILPTVSRFENSCDKVWRTSGDELVTT